MEIGFRTADTDTFLGPAAYATDAYLESLDLPQSVTYGVMMNAKELVDHDDGAELVSSMFASAASSPVDLVRIAAHYRELDAAAIIDRSAPRSRLPGRPQPHADRITIAERDRALRSPRRTTRCRSRLLRRFLRRNAAHRCEGHRRSTRASFNGPIGCHMHNNMSLGFANAMAAVDAGASWVDSTVLGMGRGPGNAQTEYLAVELSRRGLADLDVVPLLPIVTGDFADLQRTYGWGASVYYFLSAAHNIHPTYIQEMTKDGRYTVDEIVTAVEDLKSADGASFSRARLEAAAIDSGLIDPDGTWDATGWCEGRTVLIVGPGPEGVARRDDIEAYIRTAEPVVIALNAIPPVDPALVDLYAICHPVRALIDADTIKGITRPVVMPRGIQSRIGSEQTCVEFRDYGIAANDDWDDDRSVVVHIAPHLGLSVCPRDRDRRGSSRDPVDRVRRIRLRRPSPRGDGNGAACVRDRRRTRPPLTALTPTNYPIDRRSIYAPITRTRRRQSRAIRPSTAGWGWCRLAAMNSADLEFLGGVDVVALEDVDGVDVRMVCDSSPCRLEQLTSEDVEA